MSTNKKFALITLFLGLTVCAYIFSLWWWTRPSLKDQEKELEAAAQRVYQAFSVHAAIILELQELQAQNPELNRDETLRTQYRGLVTDYNAEMAHWRHFLEVFLPPEQMEKLRHNF